MSEGFADGFRPLSLAPIMELLRATGAFRSVDGLAALDKLAELPLPALPAACVLRESEAARTEQVGTGLFEQLITTTVAVVLVVLADGARHGVAIDQLSVAETAAQQALAGAALPAPVARPIEYADGRLIDVAAGRVVQMLRYRVVRRLRVRRNP